jgi:predicted SprT family Zn-dependent metalloprotease
MLQTSPEFFAHRCKKCNRIMKRTERPNKKIEYYCNFCNEMEVETQEEL